MFVTGIYRWAAAITARYHADGYIFTRAIVSPPDDGVVVIRLVEGRIGKVSIEGPADYSRNDR